jgi:hypothetical protein
MQQLFLNLIHNALKYSKKDVTPVVKIYAQTGATDKDSANAYCRIFVEDNGIGFDQKHAEQIFGMFKRLHNSSEYEGTGVGLALCKKIVEGHNGFISAQGKINDGALFIISLPLHTNGLQKQKMQLQT